MSLSFRIRTDLKRLFRRRGAVPAVIFLPVIGLLVFASVALPLLTTSHSLSVPYAICNEDSSEVVGQFIKLMANSESLKELSTAYPVNDFDAAMALLESDKVCVLVHAPADFYEKMESGGSPVVELIAKPAHSFERAMVDLTLRNALSIVGQSQTLLQNVTTVAVDAGADEDAAAEMLETSLDNGIRAYMKRRSVLGSEGTVSPLSDYMPVEFYLSALFTFFCALATLPAIHLTAGDQTDPAVRRGLLRTRGSVLRYCTARLLSCGAFIALTLALLIPLSMLSGPLRVYFGFEAGWRNLVLLLAGAALAALTFSAFAMFLGALTARPAPALWCGFYAVLLMAFLSGAILDEGRLGPRLLTLGLYLPFRPTMNVIADTLFSMNTARCLQNMLRLAGMLAFFGGASLLLIDRRQRL